MNDYFSDQEILTELGRSLKKIRLNLNMTQKESAERVGMDRATLSLMENGKASSLNYFLRLVKLYGKTEELLSVFRLPEISPMEMYKLQKKKRKKAGAKSKPKDINV
jgi:transcriptional regulator with XRE-family HTH domain